MKGEIARAGFRVIKSSASLIFACFAGVGVVATIGLGVRAGRKMVKDGAVPEPDPTKSKKENVKEEIKATWKYYIPVAISGSVTIVCIILSHKISAKQLAAMSAACGYLTSNRDKLERELKKAVGEEKFNEIKKKIALEQEAEQKEKVKYVKSAGPSVEETGFGDDLFIDTLFGRRFRSSEYHVIEGNQRFMDRYTDGDSVGIDDWERIQGLTETLSGHKYGFPNFLDEQAKWWDFLSISVQHAKKGTYQNPDGSYLDEDVNLIVWDTYPTEDYHEYI